MPHNISSPKVNITAYIPFTAVNMYIIYRAKHLKCPTNIPGVDENIPLMTAEASVIYEHNPVDLCYTGQIRKGFTAYLAPANQ